MTWHSCWTRPLSTLFNLPRHQLHLLKRNFLLQSSNTPHSAAWVTLSSQSDGGPLTYDPSAHERRELFREIQAGVQRGFKQWRRSCSNCADFFSQHGALECSFNFPMNPQCLAAGLVQFAVEKISSFSVTFILLAQLIFMYHQMIYLEAFQIFSAASM